MFRSANRKYPIVANMQPNSPAVESFRTLRTNLDYLKEKENMKVIMVSSMKPGEGKTLTIANLGIAFAMEGKRTLIIDADMRKPSLHNVFVKSNRVGLSSFLNGLCSVSEALRDTQIANLDIICAGPSLPNQADKLVNGPMGDMLAELRKSYELILIDTPPTTGAADAQMLCGLCDGVLLVVHSGKVKISELRKTRRSFELVNGRVIGAILNQADRRDIDMFVYGPYGDPK